MPSPDFGSKASTFIAYEHAPVRPRMINWELGRLLCESLECVLDVCGCVRCKWFFKNGFESVGASKASPFSTSSEARPLAASKA
eukprot:158802-Pleurochrysis_carterae.AAC.1